MSILLRSRLSRAATEILENVGRITGIVSCRPLLPGDLDDLREAVTEASAVLAAFDAATQDGSACLTSDAFWDLVKKAKQRGAA